MLIQVVRTFALCLFLGGAFTALAQPGNWQILKYPDLAGPVDRTWCFGMNPRGDMAGYYVAPGAPSRGFLLSQGTYSTIQVPGSTSTTAWGINARGEIVGDYWDIIGGVAAEHGFLLSQGKLTTIDIPGQKMSHLRDINPRGDIVGSYMDQIPPVPSVTRGFLRSKDGAITEVHFPGATGTQVFGINPQGDMVGEYGAAGTTHGFVRTKAGAMFALDYPGATFTSAWKISASGEVVGYYWDAGNPYKTSHGFVWRDGVFEQKDYPGAVHTMIHGLNSEGELCGMVSFTPLGPPNLISWGGFSRTW